MLNMSLPQKASTTWTLYLRTPQGDHFLQKSDDPEQLKRATQASVNRWISQMGLVVKTPESAMLGLSRGEVIELEAKYIAGGRRTWNPLASTSATLIRDVAS